MRVYLEFAKKSFQNNVTYRLDFFAGVINALVMIFVNISIWRAINDEEGALDGLQLKILVTYVVLSFLMQTVYIMDEYFIEKKVRSGLISSDLLKPINFRLYVFSYNVGTCIFKFIMQLVPVLLMSIFLFEMLPPFSTAMLMYFILSAILGYLVLYNLNFIVWMTSFWFYGTFSLVTIKDAAVLIFSGALIPIWFMPQWLINFIKLTPFESIFSTPIQMYLGMIPEDEIIVNIIKQVVWLVILFGVGQLLWKLGTKKLVVQGG